MNLSPLKAHKYAYNFADTLCNTCSICESVEDTEHYLLLCKSYILHRATMMRNISNIVNFNMSTIPKKRRLAILLYGIDDINREKNVLILDEVVKFIVQSKRLDTI